MNLWLRLLWVWWRARGCKKIGVLEESRLHLRVLPTDLDIYGHMNNGRYLSIMDLGRIDLIWRTGMGEIAKKKRWFPLAGSIHIQYRKSLRPFQTYVLQTRILGWDKQWFYLEQYFMSGSKEIARGVVRGLFRSRHRSLPTQELLDALGCSEVSPIIPAGINFKPKRKSDGVF